MAATQKPQLSALKTPLSASYPSELRSPLVATPTFIKQEGGGQKTPITPPAAYLDFLSKLSPTLMSPQSAGGTSRFTFPDTKPALSSSGSSESITTTASSSSYTSTAPPETSRPASPHSNASSRSSSCSSCSHESKNTTTKRPEPINTKAIMPPQSPFAHPLSARTPRRLHIPQSPYSPSTIRSPLSAASIYSPYSAALSPRDQWDPENKRSTAVSVRHVTTRTVTHYSRTPIVDPVPPSKKRKMEDGPASN